MDKKRKIQLTIAIVAAALLVAAVILTIVFRAAEPSASDKGQTLPVRIQAWENGKRAVAWRATISATKAGGTCLSSNLRPGTQSILSCQLTFIAPPGQTGDVVRSDKSAPALQSITYYSPKLKRTYALPINGSSKPTDGNYLSLSGRKSIDLKVTVTNDVLTLWQWDGSKYLDVTKTGLFVY